MPNVLHIEYPMKVTWYNGTSAQSTIFDVSRLTYAQRIECTNKFCKTLLDNRKRRQYNPDTYIIFEEAHLYFPQGSMALSRKRSTKHAWEGQAVELVTNGRNYRIRFGAITQFPSMIDKLLVKMSKQRYFGWTNEDNDVDYIAEIIGRQKAEELETLEVGEFIYSYPTRTHKTTRIKVPMWNVRSRQFNKEF